MEGHVASFIPLPPKRERNSDDAAAIAIAIANPRRAARLGRPYSSDLASMGTTPAQSFAPGRLRRRGRRTPAQSTLHGAAGRVDAVAGQACAETMLRWGAHDKCTRVG